MNRAFAILVIATIIVGIWFKLTNPASFYLGLIVYLGIPAGLLFLSALIGSLSKRAIDYVPGEWESQKTWVTFTEYERMVEDYEEAYGHLYAHPKEGSIACCLLPVSLGLGVIAIFYQEIATPLFSELIDSLILIIIAYTIIAVSGFVVGFRIPKIDATEFFKPPVAGDVYDFASELDGVRGVRAGLNVEVGRREGVQTIIDAEIRAYVQDLPDTVQLKVQVSHSGFAYPYIVGTIYKGPQVSKTSERVRLNTKYPALFEYSMDGEVAVIVARFDIPSKTRSVPSISDRDFRALAGILAQRLKELYKEGS